MKAMFQDCNSNKKYGPYDMSHLPEKRAMIRLNGRRHWVLSTSYSIDDNGQIATVSVVSWNPWS